MNRREQLRVDWLARNPIISPMSKGKTPKFDPQWAKAKNVCRLNMEDVRMAKALGLSPKTLMKNNPAPTQRWKAPVKYWIRDLYEKRFGPKPQAVRKSAQPQTVNGNATEAPLSDESVPF